MSWLFEIIENLQQERHISTKRFTMDDGASRISIGNFLTKFINDFLEKIGKDRDSYLDLPILTVYHLVVEGLVHSSNQAYLQAQRDADPQAFEILLSDTLDGGDAGILLMKDIALPDEAESKDSSLRPFIFNLQRHMIDKIQSFADELVITSSLDGRYAVYDSKSEFYKMGYGMVSEL